MASKFMLDQFNTDATTAPREFQAHPFLDPLNKRTIVDYSIIDLTSKAGTTVPLAYEDCNKNLFLVADYQTVATPAAATFTLQLPPAEKCSGRKFFLHWVDDNTINGTTAFGSLTILCGLDTATQLGANDFLKGSICFGSTLVSHAVKSGGNDGGGVCTRKSLVIAKPNNGLRLECYAAGNMWYITGCVSSANAATCVFAP
jgi:hypothetical protein